MTRKPSPLHRFGALCAMMAVALLPVTAEAAAPRKRAPAKRILTPPPVKRTLSPTPFSAPEPGDDKLAIKLSEDGKTIFLSGGIVLGSYRKFARVLGSAPDVKTVHLGSPGGLVLEGFLIAALVREKRLNTYAEVNCASSCTQILVSGIDRAASPRASIGFHKSGPVLEEGEDAKAVKEAAKSDQDLLFKLPFQRAGVEKAFLEKAFSTPHEDIWNPSHDEMLAARFLTRRSTSSEYAVPVGIGITRAEAESALLAEPIWQLVQAKRAGLFADLTEKVMRQTQAGVAKGDAVSIAYPYLLAGLASDISRAPDPLLEGFFDLTLQQISIAPELSVSSCARLSKMEQVKEKTISAVLITRERMLIEQLLSARLQPKLMTTEKAFSTLEAALGSQSMAVKPGMSKDEAACADSKDTMARLAILEPKTRNKAFRALLSFAAQLEQN